MKLRLGKYVRLIIVLLAAASTASAQSDTSNNYYGGLSLKDLLNVKIVTASKNQEFLFDAALSASAVTKEEIRRAGCSSIMEALRLVPGLIVREQSNGNYDIHLRGIDNVPPNAPFELTSNTTTLVMIDNRPIYSYLRGGTFWETLPVDINDVERIEIVRGPAAALYGPNAVSGVINIITRAPKKDGLYFVVNAREGSHRTYINNASFGYRSGKWDVIGSGNYQHRNRTQTSYFEFSRNQWFDNPDYLINFLQDTVRNLKKLYPDASQALQKYAGNVFVNYQASDDVGFHLSAGAQHSEAQKVYTENKITPLTYTQSDTKYTDVRANIKGLTTQVSLNTGRQVRVYEPGNSYDFNTLDANVEYNYTKNNVSIRPGISYRRAMYDDTKYADPQLRNGIFNARGVISTKSASLRGEYKLFDNKLKLVAGIMANKFNYPDSTYISYQLAATYKINSNHLIRAVVSKAPRSSTIYDTYVNLIISYYPTGYKKYTRMELGGNKDLKLQTANMIELGYRGTIAAKTHLDMEVFAIKASEYSSFIYGKPSTLIEHTDTINVQPVTGMNLPMELWQPGATVSLTWSSKKFQLKPFITFQHTMMKNYSPYLNTEDAGSGPYNIYSGMGQKEIFTGSPKVYGGASANYRPCEKLNINVNAYYYSKQTYYHVSNIVFNDGVRGIDTIDPKMIINANFSYTPVKDLHFMLNLKNILNDRSREFFRSDAAPFSFLIGLNYEL
jgi:iron complex outermembrane recepter protein